MTEPAAENQAPDEKGADQAVTVKRGTIRSVVFYEINEHELSVFEQGGVGSTALNFCIFLYSIGFSAVTVLATVELRSSSILYVTYLTISIVGLVLGTFMLIFWLKGSQSVGSLCKTVRERVTP